MIPRQMTVRNKLPNLIVVHCGQSCEVPEVVVSLKHIRDDEGSILEWNLEELIADFVGAFR